MIADGQRDIPVSFDDGRAEIFVTVSDDEIGLASKVFKGVTMGLGKVRHGRARLEETFEVQGELGQPLLKYLGEELCRGVPGRRILQFRIVFVVRVGLANSEEETMDAEAPFKGGKASPFLKKVREPSGVERSWDKLKA